MTAAPVRLLVGAIRFYQLYISPTRLPTCRFMPTCSQYAVEALGEHGALRGGGYALLRLLRCGPWHRGGWDPVPEARTRPSARSHRDASGVGADDLWDSPALQGKSNSGV